MPENSNNVDHELFRPQGRYVYFNSRYENHNKMNTDWTEIVIHGWYSPLNITLCQFDRARTIDEYNVIVPMLICVVTDQQINMRYFGVISQYCIKIKFLQKNGKLAYDCFHCFSMNFSCRIVNKPALVTVMPWHRASLKPLSKLMMTKFYNAIWHYKPQSITGNGIMGDW